MRSIIESRPVEIALKWEMGNEIVESHCKWEMRRSSRGQWKLHWEMGNEIGRVAK